MAAADMSTEAVNKDDLEVSNSKNMCKVVLPSSIRSLCNFQTPFCLLVWCLTVLYSIYRATKSAQELYPKLTFDDFESGWEELDSRPKDISDYEWAVFSQILLAYYPWVVIHVVITNVLKYYQPKILLHFFIISSVIFLINLLEVYPTLLLLFQILIHFAVQLLKIKRLCWAVSGIFIWSLNYENGALIKGLMDLSDSREEFILSVTISWTTCRCLSFCMLQSEKVDKIDVKNSLLEMLAYVLYFPLLLTGPIVAFDDFQRDLERRPTLNDYRSVLINVVRYSFWFVFNVVIRHYVYFSALNYHPYLVARLNIWSLCGFALGMSYFFMLKYVVLFGFPSTVAQVEGFHAPSKPKCVGRIHLYSDMWKYFDHGLYIFLKRFLYVPVVKAGQGKVFAGFLCFTFIYIWHGTSKSVFVWTLLNFVGVTLENTAKSVEQTSLYQWIQSKCSPFVISQLRTGCTAFLLIMSAISNFYFICGYEVGNILFKRIVQAGLLGPIIPIWLILICMCHSSEAIKTWEMTKWHANSNKNKN